MDQILDLGIQRVGPERRADGIRAARCEFADDITRVVHHIGVVARAARQAVGVQPAIQVVIACPTRQRIKPGAAGQSITQIIASDGVVQRVSGTGPGRTFQNQRFEVGAECVFHLGMDRVRPTRNRFNDDVGGVIYIVDVVARTACHAVGAQATIEAVIAGAAVQRVAPGATGQGVTEIIARERVVQRISGACTRGAAEHKGFKVGAQRVVHGGVDRVGPFVGPLDHLVPGAANHIGIVAQAAGHAVIASAAVQTVIAGTAIEAVIAGCAQQRVVAAIADEMRVRDARLQHVIAGTAPGILDAGGGHHAHAGGDRRHHVRAVGGQRHLGATAECGDQALIGQVIAAGHAEDGDDVRRFEREADLRDHGIVLTRAGWGAVQNGVAVIGNRDPCRDAIARLMEGRIGEEHDEARGIGAIADIGGAQRKLHQGFDLRLWPVRAVVRDHAGIGIGQRHRVGREGEGLLVDPVARAAEAADRLVAEGGYAELAIGLNSLQSGDDGRHKAPHGDDVIGEGAGEVLQELHVKRRGTRARRAEAQCLAINAAGRIARKINDAIACGVARVDRVVAKEVLDMRAAAFHHIAIMARTARERVIASGRDQHVIAIAAEFGVVTRPAVQRVAAAVAAEHVVGRIAGERVARAEELHRLDVVGERPV